MPFAQKYRPAFVRCLLVAVAMVSVVPVLLLFTATRLALYGFEKAEVKHFNAPCEGMWTRECQS